VSNHCQTAAFSPFLSDIRYSDSPNKKVSTLSIWTQNNLKIDLPYPPTVNSYYRRAGRHVYIAKAGRHFRVEVCRAIGKCEGLKGKLRVDVSVYFPDQRRRDLDNLLKGLLDALQHAGVYEDDSQISDLRVHAVGFSKEGMVSVAVEEATDEVHRSQ